jgi:hypothetical protein
MLGAGPRARRDGHRHPLPHGTLRRAACGGPVPRPIERSSHPTAFCSGGGESMPPGPADPRLHGRGLARRPTIQAEARAAARTLTHTATARNRARRAIGETARLRHCPTCGERLSRARSVLFQGNDLVHAGCWRERRQEATLPATAGEPVVGRAVRGGEGPA